MTKGDPCQQTTQIYAQLWRWFLMPQTTVTHKTGLSIWWFCKITSSYPIGLYLNQILQSKMYLDEFFYTLSYFFHFQ